MKFPVRFVTVTICLTFVVCALLRFAGPIIEKEMDLAILGSIHEIQEKLSKPKMDKL